MIRKYGRLNAPPDLVRSIFVDAESWPAWQAGVARAEVLSRSGDRFEVEVDGRFMGHRMHGIFECRIEPDGIVQNQRSGWLKRWDTRWRFTAPPDGRGTTLICELDIDAGLLGALVPSSFMHRFIDRVFSETLENLDDRAEELVAAPPSESSVDGDTVTLLEVFETPLGFEILAGGRRINLDSDDG